MNEINFEGLISIPIIRADCNFWMIRTYDGLFYNEFINEGFIAIGWNGIKKDSFPMESDQREFFEKSIKANYSTQVPGMAINKCERFCREFKEGDIAVIAGKEEIAFAVIGSYYEEATDYLTVEREIITNNLIKQKNYNEIKSCPYCKRRKITVLSTISDRDRINPYLYKALLLNKHSLSSLNLYADTILSSCLDVYYWKNTLSFAFRVQKRDNIAALSLTGFIEAFATILQIDDDELSVKTALHSPGDIVLQIRDWITDYSNLMWVVVVFMAIFGKKIGKIEFYSIFDVLKFFIERNDNKQQRHLQNEKIKQEIEALRLDNNKKIRLEAAADKLSKAVNNLELKPINNNIIKFENLTSKSNDDTD